MAETEYVVVLGGNFKPLRERFHELGGYYNGLGYAFPKEKEGILRQMVSHLPGSVLVKHSLDGKSFEAVRESSAVSFLRTRLYGVEMQLWSFCSERSILLAELSREDIESSDVLEPHKSELLGFFDERKRIQRGIAWHEGIEQTLSAEASREQAVTFLSEHQGVHYLLDDAPEMPSLVERFGENSKLSFPDSSWNFGNDCQCWWGWKNSHFDSVGTCCGNWWKMAWRISCRRGLGMCLWGLVKIPTRIFIGC